MVITSYISLITMMSFLPDFLNFAYHFRYALLCCLLIGAVKAFTPWIPSSNIVFVFEETNTSGRVWYRDGEGRLCRL
jgi:hypothetical protein